MKKYILPFFIIGLAACSNGPTQEEVMNEFVSAWNEQDFETMYTYLSEESQQNIDKKTFVERYETIYDGIEAEEITVEAAEVSEEKEEDVPRPYEVSMETVAGEISFDDEAELVKEESDDDETWKVHWDSSFIFPELQEEETVQVTSDEPVRGEIFARDGSPLAINSPVQQAGLVPGKMEDDSIKELVELLDIDEEEIESALDADWVSDESFVPVTKLRPDKEDIEEDLLEIDGIMIQESSARYYPFAEKAAHLTGYIRQVNAVDLEELPKNEYGAGSVVGSTGLESVYEEKLHGSKGWRIYIPESDTTIAEKEVENGTDITTTIDASFQQKMYDEMEGDAGAGVALHPKTGETLALVSTPAYDPNHFVFGWPDGEFEEVNEHPETPFSARFNNRYAPGSTIKPITASIALQNGSLDAKEAKTIEGKSWQPDQSWGGYKVTRVSDRLNEVNLKDALITSDNIYFAQAALHTGAENFTEGLRSFGFEEDIPYEFPVNGSAISNEGLDKDILLADTGYGQGEMLMSPIHLAVVYTPLLNDGDMLKPTLELSDDPKEVWQEQVVPAEDTEIITQGLRGIVENERGSAYEPVMNELTIAGKTGTAELKTTQGEEGGTENGWFAAYDYENEDMLITMMIENVQGRGGSEYTVEKVKNLFGD
ncbi:MULTISPECIES: penicillin-binding transpeptidase domain-containing protein [Bacillaceae]|uniref:serine-type D-Ala-D-Ala carboxypeptidase n=2 Tax=Alteribacillus bidgolensis TaxID=930129 RepID=A0A1G8H9A2_9BACI|nr:penicillin-binding protein [Alteribacillus bidgolensis]